MSLLQRIPCTLIFMLIMAINLQQSSSESRVFDGGYGFEAPINVGGESAFGFDDHSLGGSKTGFALSTGLNGLHSSLGLEGSTSGDFGYGLTASSLPTGGYAGLHNYNNFHHNPYAPSAAIGLHPSSSFGNSFYPGIRGYFGQHFGGYGIQSSLRIGNGIGSYGLKASSGLEHGLSNGYPLTTDYRGYDINF